MKVLVDGDACPVKAEVEQVATRHGIGVVIVSNGGLRPSRNPLVQMIVVDEGPDMADQWIAQECEPEDIVITSDIVLASRCLEARARALRPDGEAFTAANIGAQLAMRDLMADIRASSPLSSGGGGGKPFAKSDRSRFRDRLEREIRAAKSAVARRQPSQGQT